MAEVTWSPKARRQLQIILSIIARGSGTRTAEKWNRRFVKMTRQLESFPEIGSPVKDSVIAGFRERIVGPYRVVYHFNGTVARIVFVLRAEQELDRELSWEDLFS